RPARLLQLPRAHTGGPRGRRRRQQGPDLSPVRRGARVMATNGYAPRFKDRYREELVAALMGQLGFSNVNQVPRLEKIVVNMGVGDAIKDGRMLDAALEDLTTITGQKPVVRSE